MRFVTSQGVGIAEYNSVKTISRYVSGLETEKKAMDELEEFVDWFRVSFDINKFTIRTSVSKGPYGWKAELTAIEEA